MVVIVSGSIKRMGVARNGCTANPVKITESQMSEGSFYFFNLRRWAKNTRKRSMGRSVGRGVTGIDGELSPRRTRASHTRAPLKGRVTHVLFIAAKATNSFGLMCCALPLEKFEKEKSAGHPKIYIIMFAVCSWCCVPARKQYTSRACPRMP